MNFVVFILISALFYESALSGIIDDDGECKITKKNLPEQKLRDHLFCDYSGYDLRPVKDSKIATNLTVKLLVKYFTYDELTATLAVDSWLALYWMDQHLQWDPKEFEGITQIHVTDTDIWIPDLSLYNNADQSEEARVIDDITCVLSDKGMVVCVPTARHEALCTPDLSKFPYDTQNCTLRFGSWVHSGEELNLKFAKPAFSLEDMQMNGNWELESITAHRNTGKYKCCPNNTYPSLDYIFVIKRISANDASTIVIPSFVLLMMTLTSLWIPPNKDRLSLCYLNLLLHFIHLKYISWMVPTHGANTPYLVLFARDSMLMCSFTIILTIILRNLIQGSPNAPLWVSNLVSILGGCRVGKMILFDDYNMKGVTFQNEGDTANIINNSNSNVSENQDWLIFAKILDRLCFMAYTCVYFIMFITFLP